ncbi:MAG: RdgB/HAM1 family non-canonical purine NTP pyrophosphatase [Candidatus Methanomethylophilaceae archaeon]|nr:RdgB/HAM1 family non-canonical purine NTP pyrophosphatase [Candidatus Methanomethylophilaceae archaeon]MDD3379114.1 RdgB/HAM1 family non-canonical purine NTP pyrophosphatase [Candidatus Methanomethylophilaceae archaeon]MDY0224513.1 RdgB/HAM1 family non-canonical purine NTP pyrophosphatase [Candidatus Methanomethylophilaceae archaeon]
MKLKVITSNPGKVREYQNSFTHLGIEMEHLHLPYDEIQTFQLEEVVEKGMVEIRKKGVTDFIIDDSGLFIDSLKGFPGVWSAFAQKTIGNEGILKLMKNVSDRKAEFKCCIGCDFGGETIIVTGICNGTILTTEKGKEGFGYDPIFSYDGKLSFAEISTEEKNNFSHRGNAVRLLISELKNRSLI